jgi:hypothetical protein
MWLTLIQSSSHKAYVYILVPNSWDKTRCALELLASKSTLMNSVLGAIAAATDSPLHILATVSVHTVVRPESFGHFGMNVRAIEITIECCTVVRRIDRAD